MLDKTSQRKQLQLPLPLPPPHMSISWCQALAQLLLNISLPWWFSGLGMASTSSSSKQKLLCSFITRASLLGFLIIKVLGTRAGLLKLFRVGPNNGEHGRGTWWGALSRRPILVMGLRAASMVKGSRLSLFKVATARNLALTHEGLTLVLWRFLKVQSS